MISLEHKVLYPLFFYSKSKISDPYVLVLEQIGQHFNCVCPLHLTLHHVGHPRLVPHLGSQPPLKDRSLPEWFC